MDASSLQALATLLKPPEEETTNDDDLDVTPSPYATPGSIGCTTSKDSDSKSRAATGKDIWDPDQVSETQQYEYEDQRPQPEYDTIFKQSVGTEDVYLGMGLKNPTTSSCENLVVRIKLPGTDIKDVELDITNVFLDCRTPQWRLGLHLPHKVDSKQTKAKWISDKEELHVTLLLDREEADQSNLCTEFAHATSQLS